MSSTSGLRRRGPAGAAEASSVATSSTISTDGRPPYQNAVVVGGGLAGAVCAKALKDSNQYETVTLYEAYPHPSDTSRAAKAYCIVLRRRGQAALQSVGVDAKSIPGAITSTALARHSYKTKKTTATTSCQLAIKLTSHVDHPAVVVSRKAIAGYLLDRAEKAGVIIKYQHRLTDLDVVNNRATFAVQANNKQEQTESITYDFLLGCDGSDSMVRQLLVEKTAKSEEHTTRDGSIVEETPKQQAFEARIEEDDMEYQVVIIPKPYLKLCSAEAAKLITAKEQGNDPGIVHSWNDRATNSLCLGFPILCQDDSNLTGQEGENMGMLFTVICPGGRLTELKQETQKETKEHQEDSRTSSSTGSPTTESLETALETLLPDLSDETRQELSVKLRNGTPSTGGKCVWPSSLGYGRIALVGDSGHAMFPSLGQGANCALESAAVFCDVVQSTYTTNQAAKDQSSAMDSFPESIALAFHRKRFENSMAAVNLTYGGIGGTKSRHVKNAPIFFLLQMGILMLLNKCTFGMVPMPAMLRIMFGTTESYSQLQRCHAVYEKLFVGGILLAGGMTIGWWLLGKIMDR